MKLLVVSSKKIHERYDAKIQGIKELISNINRFVEKKKDKLIPGSYFLKVNRFKNR